LVATATLIPLAGYPLLYLPIHIVWLELIIHPTALLAFQELNTNARLKPVRERERTGQFFSTRQWIVVVVVGAALTLVVLFGYERSIGAGPNVEHARAMALVTLVIASATLTATLSWLRTLASRTIVAASLASAVIVVQTPLLAELLRVEPLHLDDWALATAGGLVPSIIASLLNGRRWNLVHTRNA
jgi:Ca2+-transporting ATPase